MCQKSHRSSTQRRRYMTPAIITRAVKPCYASSGREAMLNASRDCNGVKMSIQQIAECDKR